MRCEKLAKKCSFSFPNFYIKVQKQKSWIKIKYKKKSSEHMKKNFRKSIKNPIQVLKLFKNI